MSADMEGWDEEFVTRGFFLVKDCVPLELLENARLVCQRAVTRLTNKNANLSEGILESCSVYNQADVQAYLHKAIQESGIKERCLLLNPILSITLRCLGPDLAYNRDGAVAINIKGEVDNLYAKAHHQEIWSGAGINELRIWVPLYMRQPLSGISFIPGSHRWGLIANRERRPVEVPEAADMTAVTPKMKDGDVVMFHSMTLHTTAQNAGDDPRLAFTTGIRNIYHQATGFEFLQSWQPYHFSPMARIQRVLGNPWLSPYRTLGAPLSHRVPGDGKKDISDSDKSCN